MSVITDFGIFIVELAKEVKKILFPLFIGIALLILPPEEFLEGLEHIWIYFVAGISIEALIRTFKWHVKIRKVLNRFGVSSIIIAALLGTISPLCACGTLPLIVSLLIGGLSLAPAMALLVSAPLMSPGGYANAIEMLSLEWANAYFVAAVFMGIFAGFVTLALQKRWFQNDDLFKEALPEGSFHDPDYPDERLKCFCGEQFSNRLARMMDSKNKFIIFLAKFYEGAIKIGKFVLIGVIIEKLAEMYLDYDWIASVLVSDNPLVVPVISIAAIPLHINQSIATSFLWGFFDDGIPISKSVGMAFLIGGPVTAIPAMAVFLSLFKKRVFFLYIAICVTGTLICSYAYQYLF